MPKPSKGKRSTLQPSDHPFAHLAQFKDQLPQQRQNAKTNKHSPQPHGSPTSLKRTAQQKAASAEPKPTAPQSAGHVALTEQDKQLFLSAVGPVVPVSRTSKHHRLQQPQPKERLAQQALEDAQALQTLRDIVDGHGEMLEAETSEEPYAEALDGISSSLLRQLSRGAIAIQAHLDLHGMRRLEAHEALVRFVLQARRQDQRCVLIITGRGKSSPDGVAILRQALPRWLSRAPLRPHVLAYCTAKPNDGGPGAFYVLLRRAGIKPFGVPWPMNNKQPK